MTTYNAAYTKWHEPLNTRQRGLPLYNTKYVAPWSGAGQYGITKTNLDPESDNTKIPVARTVHQVGVWASVGGYSGSPFIPPRTPMVFDIEAPLPGGYSTGAYARTRIVGNQPRLGINLTINADAPIYRQWMPRTLSTPNPDKIPDYTVPTTNFGFMWRYPGVAPQYVSPVYVQPYEFEVNASMNMSSVLVYRTSFYLPPAPEPAVDENPPAFGGVTIRALHGIVVDMDTPTVVDGIPT